MKGKNAIRVCPGRSSCQSLNGRHSSASKPHPVNHLPTPPGGLSGVTRWDINIISGYLSTFRVFVRAHLLLRVEPLNLSTKHAVFRYSADSS